MNNKTYFTTLGSTKTYVNDVKIVKKPLDTCKIITDIQGVDNHSSVHGTECIHFF